MHRDISDLLHAIREQGVPYRGEDADPGENQILSEIHGRLDLDRLLGLRSGSIGPVSVAVDSVSGGFALYQLVPHGAYF